MTIPPFSRRAVLRAVVMGGPVLRASLAASPDRILVAIRSAQAADALYRAAWHSLGAGHANFAFRAADRAHLANLRENRRAARFALHGLTPSSAAGARALVAYYASRAAASGDASVAKAARRRLRKVFARPGACGPDCALPAVLAPPLTAGGARVASPSPHSEVTAMKITRVSMISGTIRTLDLPVTPEQIAAHQAGALIQDAFPNLLRWQREFILTGITDEEWQAAFPPEDEIDADEGASPDA
jgi:hypothetical protein